MFVIKKIEVYDIDALAGEIAGKMPDFEIDPYRIDEYGDFNETFEIDIEVEFNEITLTILGTVRAQGYSIVTTHSDPYLEPDHDFNQVNEVHEFDYFIDGEEIEFDERFDLENKINELI